MKIECTPQELKELIQKETPVAVTTDVIKISSEKFASALAEYRNFRTTK